MKCFIVLAILQIALGGHVRVRMPYLNPAGITYLTGPAAAYSALGYPRYSIPEFSAPSISSSATYSAPNEYPTSKYSVTYFGNGRFSPNLVRAPSAAIVPTIHQVPAIADLPVTRIQAHPGVIHKELDIAKPAVKTSRFELRRPAIQKQFYDIEERIVVRPAGSALLELDHPDSKVHRGSVVRPVIPTFIAHTPVHAGVIVSNHGVAASNPEVVISTPRPTELKPADDDTITIDARMPTSSIAYTPVQQEQQQQMKNAYGQPTDNQQSSQNSQEQNNQKISYNQPEEQQQITRLEEQQFNTQQSELQRFEEQQQILSEQQRMNVQPNFYEQQQQEQQQQNGQQKIEQQQIEPLQLKRQQMNKQQQFEDQQQLNEANQNQNQAAQDQNQAVQDQNQSTQDQNQSAQNENQSELSALPPQNNQPQSRLTQSSIDLRFRQQNQQDQQNIQPRIFQESRTNPSNAIPSTRQLQTEEDSRSNQQRLIELFTAREGITELNGGSSQFRSNLDTQAFVRSRVLSAQFAPKDEPIGGEKVNTRRIVVSRPIETIEEVDVVEPVTKLHRVSVQQPAIFKTAHVGLERIQTSVPVYGKYSASLTHSPIYY